MTIYFQVQFLKLKCTDNAKSTIKNERKNERKKKVSSMKKYHQGPGKKWTREKKVSILNDDEEQAFPYLPSLGKFGYKAPRDIPISPFRYFNQILLKLNQYFASYGDYLFFARSACEQQH